MKRADSTSPAYRSFRNVQRPSASADGCLFRKWFWPLSAVDAISEIRMLGRQWRKLRVESG